MTRQSTKSLIPTATVTSAQAEDVKPSLPPPEVLRGQVTRSHSVRLPAEPAPTKVKTRAERRSESKALEPSLRTAQNDPASDDDHSFLYKTAIETPDADE